MKKIVFSVLLSTFLLFGISVPSTFAESGSSISNDNSSKPFVNYNLTQTDYEKISDHMKNDGASSEQIKSVLAKLKKGQPLDSETGETEPLQTITEKPVLTKNTDLIKRGGPITTSTTSRYPDGSYKKITLSAQPDETSNKLFNSDAIKISPLGKVQICAWESVNISGSDEMGSVGYHATIGINTAGYNTDEISSVGSSWVHMLYGSTAQDKKLEITRHYEVYDQRISAKSDFHFDEDWIGIQKTMYLKLHVGHFIGDSYGIWGQYAEGNGNTHTVHISY
ncbi:MAG: hypothetical protein K0Q87_1356 [Neobacillus sp.]|jgi:hypothetical protein|nr:hypothetical protein [Neobacillus sp.]